MTTSGLFLDRDGVLNPDVGYAHRLQDATLFADVAPLLRAAVTAGVVPVVVTNQSGIGRGYYTVAEADRFNARLSSLLEQQGVELPVSHFYMCPHLPEAGCDCRKPKPGLLQRGARDLGIDLSASVLVGDSERDVEAAHHAGVRAALLVRMGSIPSTRAEWTIGSLSELIPMLDR
jgi:histidinol-phosphate phosphatase family protein